MRLDVIRFLVLSREVGEGVEARINPQDESVPFLLFHIRQRLCGLPIIHVAEIMRPLPTEAIAGAPAGVKGLAVIRGMPTPVLDLGALLDDQDARPTRFITVRTGSRHVALAVESVVGLRYVSADTVRNTPPLFRESSEVAVGAIGTLDAELLIVLNAAHLVPESVWQAINASGESA
jgi:purine-binding chemotaxis protein CheW